MGNGQCARTLHNLLFYLRNFFESIAIVQRQNMQEKWLCEQSRLEINRLYVCIHSTVLIQYFFFAVDDKNETALHTQTTEIQICWKFMICCFYYCRILQDFYYVLYKISDRIISNC